MSAPLSQSLEWELANRLWAQALNPIIANPIANTRIIPNQVLINGVTVINHGLGRLMQGWFLVDINGASTIYRSAPMSDRILTLTSSAIVTVNIGVF